MSPTVISRGRGSVTQLGDSSAWHTLGHVTGSQHFILYVPVKLIFLKFHFHHATVLFKHIQGLSHAKVQISRARSSIARPQTTETALSSTTLPFMNFISLMVTYSIFQTDSLTPTFPNHYNPLKCWPFKFNTEQLTSQSSIMLYDIWKHWCKGCLDEMVMLLYLSYLQHTNGRKKAKIMFCLNYKRQHICNETLSLLPAGLTCFLQPSPPASF